MKECNERVELNRYWKDDGRVFHEESHNTVMLRAMCGQSKDRREAFDKDDLGIHRAEKLPCPGVAANYDRCLLL